MREFIVFYFYFLIQILAQTMNSRTHEPREYRGNIMRVDISTLTVSPTTVGQILYNFGGVLRTTISHQLPRSRSQLGLKHGQKCLFSILNSFHPIFTKLCENVCGN